MKGDPAVHVPFLDLRAQYLTIESEIREAIGDVMASCAFAGGRFVEEFESRFAGYCGTAHCVAVGNGTEALWIALVALGVGRGDEVITAANSFIATAEAVSMTGARPVFVDVDPATYAIDPDAAEAAVTPRTRAIIPVHLYGQCAEMDRLRAIADRHGLALLEDACQAHGAELGGRRAGSLGDAAAFSFYPGKNLGAYGEAGAVTTSDAALAARMRMLRDHGQSAKYHHDAIGWNARMDGIQGAVLTVKLRYIEQWTEARRAHAARYRELLSGLATTRLPTEGDGRRHVYHLYVVEVDERDAVKEALAAAGIHCGIHYPVPIPMQPAYGGTGRPTGTHPVAERAAGRLLSLPMYPELSDEQVARVAGELAGIVRTSVPAHL